MPHVDGFDALVCVDQIVLNDAAFGTLPEPKGVRRPNVTVAPVAPLGSDLPNYLTAWKKWAEIRRIKWDRSNLRWSSLHMQGAVAPNRRLGARGFRVLSGA